MDLNVFNLLIVFMAVGKIAQKEDEIVICEIIKSGYLPRYRLQKDDFGTYLFFVDSPNSIHLGYPFQILLWALPSLLKTNYEEGRTLNVSSEDLERVFSGLVRGNLFSSDKSLEAELMGRFKREFSEEYQKHFG